ncbi:MAG: hypothetical protein CMI63_03905 [Parvularcula sp.]|nr:hypothetical protein [Parvularcula sp.]
MTDHWTDQNKHRAKGAFANAQKPGSAGEKSAQPRVKDDANFAFDQANYRKFLDQRTAQRNIQPPRPQLTPKGPMRETVDRQVREKQAAIKAKFARDREVERER